jgi:hypothetical protein
MRWNWFNSIFCLILFFCSINSFAQKKGLSIFKDFNSHQPLNGKGFKLLNRPFKITPLFAYSTVFGDLNDGMYLPRSGGPVSEMNFSYGFSFSKYVANFIGINCTTASGTLGNYKTISAAAPLVQQYFKTNYFYWSVSAEVDITEFFNEKFLNYSRANHFIFQLGLGNYNYRASATFFTDSATVPAIKTNFGYQSDSLGNLSNATREIGFFMPVHFIYSRRISNKWEVGFRLMYHVFFDDKIDAANISGTKKDRVAHFAVHATYNLFKEFDINSNYKGTRVRKNKINYRKM